MRLTEVSLVFGRGRMPLTIYRIDSVIMIKTKSLLRGIVYHGSTVDAVGRICEQLDITPNGRDLDLLCSLIEDLMA